ncbi:hypothetical protein B0J13DRAFT_457717, partial [Dactylonectria estremocensis]
IPPTLSLPTVVLGTSIPQTPIPQTPIPRTPIPRGTLPTAPVVLGTPISQESFPTTLSLLPQGHHRGRYTRQGTFNPWSRPQPQERQFDQIVDPPLTADLNLPVFSEEDQTLVQEFYTALTNDKMHSCIRCQERWFDMKRNSSKSCSCCISQDKERAPNEPYFFSTANNLNFGEVPGNLPNLTIVKEMLIARVHVHMKVLQVRGAQYKYRGHVDWACQEAVEGPL